MVKILVNLHTTDSCFLKNQSQPTTTTPHLVREAIRGSWLLFQKEPEVMKDTRPEEVGLAEWT